MNPEKITALEKSLKIAQDRWRDLTLQLVRYLQDSNITTKEHAIRDGALKHFAKHINIQEGIINEFQVALNPKPQTTIEQHDLELIAQRHAAKTIARTEARIEANNNPQPSHRRRLSF